MNAHPASTEMGWGRGNAPFPSAPSPRTTLGRLHKTLDTPSLFRAVVTQSYLLILQGIALNSYLILLPSYWSQNGAKLYKSEPAEICLNSTRLRGASAYTERTEKS